MKPCLLFVRLLQNAVSAALPRGPMIRSIWATSLPSPTSDFADHHLVDLCHLRFLPEIGDQGRSGLRPAILSLFSAFGGAEPVGQIATGR